MLTCPDPKPIRGAGVVLALWYLAMLPAMVQAADAPSAPDEGDAASFVLQAESIGVGPYAQEAGGKPLPMTLYAGDGKTRADFTGPAGERAMALHDGARDEGWMISLDRGIAVPFQGTAAADLRVDPGRPCAHLPRPCQRTDSRFIAGRAVTGWRYHGANARGPGGTSKGEFWVDTGTGVVLAYRGTKQGWEQVYAMTATSIRYGKLPADLFDLPETVDVYDADAGNP